MASGAIDLCEIAQPGVLDPRRVEGRHSRAYVPGMFYESARAGLVNGRRLTPCSFRLPKPGGGRANLVGAGLRDRVPLGHKGQTDLRARRYGSDATEQGSVSLLRQSGL